MAHFLRGTTCSGLAWAQTGRNHLEDVIEQWPRNSRSTILEGLTDKKVPTTLKYDENSDSYRWGFQIKDIESKHEWFKLGLDPTQDRDTSSLAKKYPNTLPPITESECEKYVVDYLTALRKHAENYLQQKLGEGASVVLRTTPREYVITVPAVWSEKAKAKTLSCAERAGMGSGDNLHMITEPEAAAIYALDNIAPMELKEGDTFVLCDAGGGTVDLISYTVSVLKPVIELDEAATGSGGLCGSTFLNRIFAKYMRDKFESHPKWREEILTRAMRQFDSDIKKKFQGDPDDSATIPVYPIEDSPPAISRGDLFLSSKVISKEIFDPVIDEIIKLVRNQIRATKKKVRAVLLVGGFGENSYLRKRMQAEIGERIRVIPGHQGQTAVVRGALMRGLAEASPHLARIRPRFRKARKHYGVICVDEFDEKIHDPQKRKSDPFSGKDTAEVMKWFIHKGDSVKESVPASFDFFLEKKVSQGRPLSIKMEVYSYDDPRDIGAPNHPTDAVTKLVELTADLRTIPESQLKQEPGANKQMYYMMKFDIEMICYSAATSYILIYDGVKYDTVTTEYV